jgi:hypothetical protein
MINGYFKKSLVLGIVFLFLGAGIVPIISGYSIKQNALTSLTMTNSKVSNNYMDTPQFRLIDLCLSLNGTGKTATNLSEFKDEWKVLLKFEFIDADADMKVDWFGLPLWKWFPKIYNPKGPHIYVALMFFGSIEKIDDRYHIEGHCFRATTNF